MKKKEENIQAKAIEQICDKIAAFAVESMLFEVSATPKPGLVDRNNAGAHHDMDYFTFMSSAAALHESFDEFVWLGWQYQSHTIQELLPALRKSGKIAEQKMFTFTKGINTHKGMIFTLGILCGCAGWLIGKKILNFENLSALTIEMCQGICEKEYAGLEQKFELTKGERMYLQYGCTGVRGEVENGYQTINQFSLPIYTKLRKDGTDVNDSLVQTLLHLIAGTCDTNILSRHDMNTALYVKAYAEKVLRLGGIFTAEGKAAIEEMDQDFIENYISPGGCADLLAVTHFLYSLEQYSLFNKHFVLSERSSDKKWRALYGITGDSIAVSNCSNHIRIC